MKYIKKIGWYLLELIAVFALLYGLFRGDQAIERALRNGFFEIDLYFDVHLAYAIAYPFIFGILIRVPSLIRRWSGDRHFNWLRFCVLVAPVLLLIIQFYAAFIFGIGTRLWLPVFATGGTVLPLLGIWTGVNLMDCIKGKPRTAEGNADNSPA